MFVSMLPEHLKTVVVSRYYPWYRICRSDYRSALGCGFGSSRFSDPVGKDYKVIYLGQTPAVCFNEVIYRENYINPMALPINIDVVMQNYYLGKIQLRQPLVLVKLTGSGPSAMKIPTDAVKGSSHKLGQALSRAIWEHSDVVDGLIYRSRLNDDHINIAIYDRARHKLRTSKKVALVDCKSRLASIFDELGISSVT